MRRKERDHPPTNNFRNIALLIAGCVAVFMALSALPRWEKHHAFATVVTTSRGNLNGTTSPKVTIDWQYGQQRASAMRPVMQLMPGDRVCVRYSLNRYDVPIRIMVVFDRLCTTAGLNPPVAME